MLFKIIKQWVISTISIAFHLHLIVPSDLFVITAYSTWSPFTGAHDISSRQHYHSRIQSEEPNGKARTKKAATPDCSAAGEWDLSDQCTKWTSSGLPLAVASRG